ncbi:MAG: hypothetical protein LBT86_04925 [Deltaproteobacteria bacterium]|jgi:hypothetical protein|nr:hypothetical protein [Deltaproteobacteria bacterium]
MEQLKSSSPTNQEIQIIVASYLTLKTAKVTDWPRNKPNFNFPRAPTYSSWLNSLESWLKEFTDKSIRRGSFHSAKELVKKIYLFIERCNHC